MDLSLFLSQFLCLHLETRKKRVVQKIIIMAATCKKIRGMGYDDTVHSIVSVENSTHIHRNARLGTFLGVVVLDAAGL